MEQKYISILADFKIELICEKHNKLKFFNPFIRSNWQCINCILSRKRKIRGPLTDRQKLIRNLNRYLGRDKGILIINHFGI